MLFSQMKKVKLVKYTILTSNHGLLLSYTRFGHVDYSGTFFIADRKDDDFAGIVFGYQSNRSETHFYFIAQKERCENMLTKSNLIVQSQI